MAPGVTLYIANAMEWGELKDVVNWMKREGVQVVNFSIGYNLNAPGDGTSLPGPSNRPHVIATINDAVSNDIFWVNAVGNDGENTWFGDYMGGNASKFDQDGDGYISFFDRQEINGIRLKRGQQTTIEVRWQGSWRSSTQPCLLEADVIGPDSRNRTEVWAGVEHQREGRLVPYYTILFTPPVYVPAPGEEVETNQYKYGYYYLALDRFKDNADGTRSEQCPISARPDWIQMQNYHNDAGEVSFTKNEGTDLNFIHTYNGPNFGQIGVPSEINNPGTVAVGAADLNGTSLRGIDVISNKGPTNYGSLRPDLVGVHDMGASGGDTHGTSFAAPQVAGMAALVLGKYKTGWGDQYTPEILADWLRRTAAQQTESSPNNTDPNHIWGHGFAKLPNPTPTVDFGLGITSIRENNNETFTLTTNVTGTNNIWVKASNSNVGFGGRCTGARDAALGNNSQLTLRGCSEGETLLHIYRQDGGLSTSKRPGSRILLRVYEINVTAAPPVLDAPPAPAGLDIDSATATSLQASWSSVANTTKYRLQYRRSGSGSWTTASSSITGTRYRVSGLSCGRTYEFQVAAYGNGTDYGALWGPYSSTRGGTTSGCLPLPPAPSVTVGFPERTSLLVSWDSVANTTKYRVQYRRGNSGGWNTATDDATGASHRVTGLTCGTSYQIRVTAYGDGTVYDDDWGIPSAINTVSTDVCPDPVFNPSSYSADLPENTPLHSEVVRVTATDPNPGDVVSYSITGGNTGDTFGIGASSGAITLAAELDRSETSAYRLTVEARDPAGNTDTATVRITVGPPQLPEVAAPTQVRRESSTPTQVTVRWDAVAGASRYRLEYRPVGASSWLLSTANATTLSHPVSGLSCATSYEFQVTAHGDGVEAHPDWGRPSAVATLETSICPDPYFINEPYSFDVGENAGVGAYVGRVTALDPNPGDVVTYRIGSGNGAGKFAIDGSSGNITVAASLEGLANRSYTLGVTARDAAGHSDTTSVRINVVENVAPAPENVAGLVLRRNHIALSWDVVADTIKYRVQYRRSGDTDWSTASDTIEERFHTVYGLECDTAYQFQVSAYSDGSNYVAGWGITSPPVAASTTDCEEPVFDEEEYSFTVFSNARPQKVVGTVRATDPSTNPILRYSIVSGNEAGKFAINGNSGAITTTRRLDTHPVVRSYYLMVQVEDNTQQTDATVVGITVNNPVTVNFGQAQQTVAEEGGSVSVTVALDAAPGVELTIPLVVTEHNGLTGADYSGVPSSVSLGAQETSASFSVSIVDDSVDDDGESLEIAFGTLPDGVRLGSPAATTIAIEDNDEVPVEVTVWSANLTVGSYGASMGYDRGSQGTPGGGISDDSLDWEGRTYRVNKLTLRPVTSGLTLELSKSLPARSEGWVLHIGNSTYDLGRAKNRRFTWQALGEHWFVGQRLEVRITYLATS